MSERETALIERLRTKLGEHDPENPFHDGLWVRNEHAAILLALAEEAIAGRAVLAASSLRAAGEGDGDERE